MMHSPFAIGRLILHEMDRQQLSRVDLVRRFGFANIAKGLRRLDRLLETGFEPSLMSKIAGALYIDQQTVDHAIIETDAELARERDDACQRDDDRERQNFRPYILVQTEGFSWAGLFAAVQYERLKRIPVPANILDKLLADQIAWVSRTIAAHFVQSGGRLDAFGPIAGYHYRRTFDDAIRFVHGRPVNYFEPRPIEVRPRLGNKRRRMAAPKTISAPRNGGCGGFAPLMLSEDDHLGAW
jgi:hypothetical protein